LPVKPSLKHPPPAATSQSAMLLLSKGYSHQKQLTVYITRAGADSAKPSERKKAEAQKTTEKCRIPCVQCTHD
jgi:hypothetical protein